MNSRRMPTWLTVLLIVFALAVLGPLALPFVLAAVAVAVSLSAVLIKVGVFALAVYLLVALFRGLRAPRRQTVPRPPPARASLAMVELRLEDEERARRAALDRELESAVRANQRA